MSTNNVDELYRAWDAALKEASEVRSIQAVCAVNIAEIVSNTGRFPSSAAIQRYRAATEKWNAAYDAQCAAWNAFIDAQSGAGAK